VMDRVRSSRADRSGWPRQAEPTEHYLDCQTNASLGSQATWMWRVHSGFVNGDRSAHATRRSTIGLIYKEGPAAE
jgi:hypothetical protein